MWEIASSFSQQTLAEPRARGRCCPGQQARRSPSFACGNKGSGQQGRLGGGQCGGDRREENVTPERLPGRGAAALGLGGTARIPPAGKSRGAAAAGAEHGQGCGPWGCGGFGTESSAFWPRQRMGMLRAEGRQRGWRGARVGRMWGLGVTLGAQRVLPSSWVSFSRDTMRWPYPLYGEGSVGACAQGQGDL